MAGTSRAFDRAVDYYDQTRRLTEPMASAGIQAILDHLHTRRNARLLEVGAGTGRIVVDKTPQALIDEHGGLERAFTALTRGEERT